MNTTKVGSEDSVSLPRLHFFIPSATAPTHTPGSCTQSNSLPVLACWHTQLSLCARAATWNRFSRFCLCSVIVKPLDAGLKYLPSRRNQQGVSPLVYIARNRHLSRHRSSDASASARHSGRSCLAPCCACPWRRKLLINSKPLCQIGVVLTLNATRGGVMSTAITVV